MKVTTRPRNAELALGLLAVLITGFGYLLVQLADKPNLPPDLWAFLAAVIGLYVVAHLAVRRFAPNSDPTLLPLAALLNGVGFVTISRLDRDLARIQAGWTAAGVAAFVITLVVVRRIRTLERYRYTFLFNLFVWMQLWNELNCRSIRFNRSPFAGVFSSVSFLGVVCGIAACQVLIVQFGGDVFSTVGLGARDWALSVGLGASVLVVGAAIRAVGRRVTTGGERR